MSCVEEIDLNIDTDQRSVVVDGLIADELQEYTIRINESAILGVGTDNILTPISGAIVEVRDDAQGVYTFEEDAESPGKYKAVMKGEVGRSYLVEIRLSDGTEIISAPEKILPKVYQDSLSFDVTSEGEINSSGNFVTIEYVNVKLSTSIDENDRPFLRWRASGVYEFQEKYPMAFNPLKCYIDDNIDINNIQIFDGSLLNGVNLYDQEIVSTPLNRRFNVLYATTVVQYRISEREYDYWANVNDLINIDGTLFDPPPATIRGNLINITNPNNTIQGYFSVVSQSTQRLFIDVTSQGFFAESECTFQTFRQNPPECADCTLIQNSSLLKPDYWPY
jgi:hypothetical protein